MYRYKPPLVPSKPKYIPSNKFIPDTNLLPRNHVLQDQNKLEIYLTKGDIQIKIEELNELMENRQLIEAHITEINNIDTTVIIDILSAKKQTSNTNIR